MLTIPLESSYVNVIVFLVFDVVVVILLAANLASIQGANVLRLLSSGHRVKIRESPFLHIIGHIRADGTSLWITFTVLQFLALTMLFFATLGINGRTEFIQIPTARRYLTHLPLEDRDFEKRRFSPPLFSSCATTVGSEIHYFPAAFDTVGNTSISDEAQFQDKNGTSVQVNASSVVCQNTTGFTPMLRVYRCGNRLGECSNFNMSTPKVVKLVGNSQAEFGGIKGGVLGNRTLRSLLDVPAGVLSDVHYSYLICTIWEVAKRKKGKMKYLCNAGVFDEVQLRYRFRIGKVEFPVESYDAVHERLDTNVTVNFTAYSNEVEMEYDVLKHGVVSFGSALTQKNHKAQPISARTFLDYLVDRYSSSMESGDTDLFEPATREVTDIAKFTVVLYSILFAFSLMAWLIRLFWVQKYGPKMTEGRICTSVTTYEGITQLLRCSRGACKRERGVELGLVKNKLTGMLKVAALDEGQQREALRKEGMFECCIDELKARVKKQLSSAQSSARLGLDKLERTQKDFT